MALTGRQHAGLFRAREARLERRLRAGAGYAAPQNLAVAGTGITPPIASGEEALPVALTFSFEFRDPGGADYPAGTLLDTGEFQLALDAAGTLTVNGGDTIALAISVDLSDPTIPGGGVPQNRPSGGFIRNFALYLEPGTNPAVARAAVWVDGVQVGSDTGEATVWSSGTWSFMNGVADVGFVSNLQVFPGFVPPTFVG